MKSCKKKCFLAPPGGYRELPPGPIEDVDIASTALYSPQINILLNHILYCTSETKNFLEECKAVLSISTSPIRPGGNSLYPPGGKR